MSGRRSCVHSFVHIEMYLTKREIGTHTHTHTHSDDNYSSGDEDGVLLFDDEMGSFRVYEDEKQPTTPAPETPKKEEEENTRDNKVDVYQLLLNLNFQQNRSLVLYLASLISSLNVEGGKRKE